MTLKKIILTTSSVQVLIEPIFLSFCTMVRLCGWFLDHGKSCLKFGDFTLKCYLACFYINCAQIMSGSPLCESITEASIHMFMLEPVFLVKVFFPMFCVIFSKPDISKILPFCRIEYLKTQFLALQKILLALKKLF